MSEQQSTFLDLAERNGAPPWLSEVLARAATFPDFPDPRLRGDAPGEWGWAERSATRAWPTTRTTTGSC